MADCAEDNSEANELMLKRVAYHGLNYAAPFVDQVSGKRHHQKSVEGFNRLPEIFTREDVMKCFGYKNESGVNSKIKRLVDDKIIEVSELFVEDGHQHFKYKKIGSI